MSKNRELHASAWLVGDLLVDPQTRVVSRGSQRIKLPRLSLDLLLALVEAAPDTLSADQLLTRVWQGRVVSPATVTKRVELLRHALGDNSEEPRYVALEHGYGYRLIPQPQPVKTHAGSGDGQNTNRRWLLFGVVALVAAAVLIYVLMRPDTVVEAPPERSIAVLPFLSLGEDSADQLFADGLTEELGHTLARSSRLRVIGRTSSFRFRDADADARAIGEALGVAHLLEGTVRRSEDRLRVVATLTRTSDGVLRWTEAFDRDMADLIDIQQDIAARVAEELRVTFGGADRRPTEVPEAYALYLKAVSLMEYPFGSDLPRAQSLLEQAVALDPAFARAWAFLAAVHLRRQLWNERTYTLSPEESLATMRDAVDRALAADPDDGWAYGVLAAIAWTIEDDIAKAAPLAEQHARGLQGSNDLQFLMFTADLSMSLGLLEQARRWQVHVLTLDPLCDYCRIRLTGTLNALGRHEEAIRVARMLLQTGPESEFPAWHLGLSQLYAGEHRASIKTFQTIDNNLLRRSGLAMANYSLGNAAEAESQWQILQTLDDGGPAPLQLAYAAAWLGKDDEALDILELWSSRRDLRLSIQISYSSPAFSRLHGTPRWHHFLENIGRAPEQVGDISFSPPMPDGPVD